MKICKIKLLAGAVFFSGVVMTPPNLISAENVSPERSQALLEKVKQREQDRQVALRKIEMDRLNEDISKGKSEAEAMQQNIDSTASLITESGQNLQDLLAEKARLQQNLNVTAQRIEAERKRADGLRALSDAQGKSLAALNKRLEGMGIASQVQSAESKLISEGQPLPDYDSGEHHNAELTQLRKSLATSVVSSTSQEKVAREAIKGASAKLAAADAAAAKAKQMAEQAEQGTPEPVAEKPVEKKVAPPVKKVSEAVKPKTAEALKPAVASPQGAAPKARDARTEPFHAQGR